MTAADIQAIRDAQIVNDIKAIRAHLPVITDLDSKQYQGAVHPERIARLLAALEDAQRQAQVLRSALEACRGQWIHSVNAPQCLAAMKDAP